MDGGTKTERMDPSNITVNIDSILEMRYYSYFNWPRRQSSDISSSPQHSNSRGSQNDYGPEAWMEGLRQKGWTLVTLLLILIVSWKCGTIATLTGQGDNQVIYLRLPNTPTLEGLRMTRSQYISWFQETLFELCAQAGITLKLKETWVSTSLLEYGEFFFKGAQVSSALKRISRMASEANQTETEMNPQQGATHTTCTGHESERSGDTSEKELASITFASRIPEFWADQMRLCKENWYGTMGPYVDIFAAFKLRMDELIAWCNAYKKERIDNEEDNIMDDDAYDNL
ncbi:hypothetical protein PYW07_009352 [Mythimna separata]|uniref:RdRp catalytic domain-containing protein n=1 Tax=Mythimna separata TaxID=271217 RepID=A0AAD8DN49_MYTSE|nr:hypothetical protein PYW07_009352 [Mythimna separata]